MFIFYWWQLKKDISIRSQEKKINKHQNQEKHEELQRTKSEFVLIS